MKLVERVEQKTLLKRILTECAAGKGAVVLLDGPGGSGKTELLHQAAEDAARSGALVLRASCSRAERALPFGVLGQLLYTVPADSGPGVRLQLLHQRLTAKATTAPTSAPAQPGSATATASVSDTAAAATGIGPELALLLNQVAEAVLELAESDDESDVDTPMVFIGIDNLRHADPHSLDCLLYLARRTGSARVTLVLTDDAVAQAGRSQFRTELLDQPHTRRIALAPLAEEQVAELLAGHLGDRDEAGRLAGEFRACSGGNLLLLRALIEDHETSGGVRREGYGRAVLRQLGLPELISTCDGCAPGRS